MEYKKYFSTMFVVFLLLASMLLISCAENEQEEDLFDDYEDETNYEVSEEQEEDSSDVAEVILDGTEKQRYIDLNVELTCLMYGDEELFLEEHDLDAIAHQHGFNSIAEAEEIGGMLPDISLEFIQGLEEQCPEVLEMFE
jgi:hypothetical protein